MYIKLPQKRYCFNPKVVFSLFIAKEERVKEGVLGGSKAETVRFLREFYRKGGGGGGGWASSAGVEEGILDGPESRVCSLSEGFFPLS